jgi:hypothetical protein
MQERAIRNDNGCISCAGPSRDNSFALCIAQTPLVPGTKTAMIVVSRGELAQWLKQVNRLVEESIRP